MNLTKFSGSKEISNYLLVIFLFGILIYIPSINVHFINDEISFISRNEAHSFSELVSLFDKKTYDGEYYRPLPNFISGVITSVFNYNPVPYRIFNLILHSFSGALVFLFCINIIKHNDKILISVFAALFFLAFPLHDYAVIWHTDLFDRVMLIFYLGGLIAFITNNFRPGVLSCILFSGALLSKEMAFSFPLIIFLITFLLYEGRFDFRKSLKAAFPYLVICAAFILLRILLFNNNIFAVNDAHAGHSLYSILKNYIMFGGILVFPFFLREIEQVILNYNLIFLALGFAVFIPVLILLIRTRRKDFLLIFFILFVIITIAPASRLLMRWYLYLPSVGFTAGLSYLIFSLNYKRQYLLFSAMLILAVYSFSVTFKISDWTEYTTKADIIMKEFSNRYKYEVPGKEIGFLTIPAKVNDIPVFQLGFDSHLKFYFGENNIGEVNLYSKSVLSALEDNVSIEKKQDGFLLEQKRDNYFILSGNEKNIKFDSTKSLVSVQQSRKRSDSRIQSVIIKPEDENKILFTFSQGRFIKIKE